MTHYNLITVHRRYEADVQDTEETSLTDDELAEFEALGSDEEKYEFLIDHELTTAEQRIMGVHEVHRLIIEVDDA